MTIIPGKKQRFVGPALRATLLHFVLGRPIRYRKGKFRNAIIEPRIDNDPNSVSVKGLFDAASLPDSIP